VIIIIHLEVNFLDCSDSDFSDSDCLIGLINLYFIGSRFITLGSYIPDAKIRKIRKFYKYSFLNIYFKESAPSSLTIFLFFSIFYILYANIS